eukprot:scaffold14803_cov67-Phaeocystis_antarctica.AAC.4
MRLVVATFTLGFATALVTAAALTAVASTAAAFTAVAFTAAAFTVVALTVVGALVGALRLRLGRAFSSCSSSSPAAMPVASGAPPPLPVPREATASDAPPTLAAPSALAALACAESCRFSKRWRWKR